VRVILAGLICRAVKPSIGTDNDASEEAEYGAAVEDRLVEEIEPWLDFALRCDCRAFARAFS
jgi:hypothetical protein